MVFGGGSYPNLPDAHPPFQIDGNFGAAAGIAHMLLGNSDHAIHLLPALPACWSGSEHGLRAMGGLLVDIRFVKGTLESATISVPEGCTPPAVLYQGKPADSRVTIAPVRFWRKAKRRPQVSAFCAAAAD